MNSNQVREYLLSKPEAEEYFPFGPDVNVFKIKDKVFALLFMGREKDYKKRPRLNLKCDPLEALQLRDIFDDVVAGYHMNKKHWNTLYLTNAEKTSDIPSGEIERQIDHSYSLVVKGLTKAMRHSLELIYSDDELYKK